MRKYVTQFSVFACLLLLGACSKRLYPHQQPARQYAITGETPVDSNMFRMLLPYKKGVDTQMQVVIGHTDIPLTKAQPESTLGNFMADAQLMAARVLDPKVDVSVSNYGGIRVPYIEAGPLTRGKIFELMPFDNMLIILELPGTILKQFCDHIAKARGWPVSGITFVIKDKQATNILVNGTPLNEHLYYKLATSDYVAKGGDNCDFLSSTKKRYTSIFIRDALIAYINRLEQEGKPLHPQIENRITYAE
jgi:2',3'-cyclic-nucleotide 2'-phosphodiesterase (5'-nucleotidase family)